jgi:hypothetical protein
MKIKIPNAEVQELLSGIKYSYPKYVTQLLVLANQNAQGTRPKVVGQMSELVQEFTGRTVEEWIVWYTERHPDSIDKATDRIYDMVLKLKTALDQTDKEVIKQWVTELLHVKTFSGLRFQAAILIKVAAIKKTTYRLSMADEEAKGIDGFIGTIPVSIKPTTYKLKKDLREVIDAAIIYYEKKKNEIVVEFDF